jgi:hypothetical protein
MTRSLLASCLVSAFISLKISATTIVDVSHVRGSVNGGDVITVQIDDPPTCSITGCGISFLFGGIPAHATTELRTNGPGWLYRVITPAHGRGSVELTMTQFGREIARSPNRFSYMDLSDGQAFDSFNYETILIPLAVGTSEPLDGAFGSKWTTEFWVSNSGDRPIEFFYGWPACASADCGVTPPVVAPHATRLVDLPADSTGAGYLFYAQKGGAENLLLSLRVRDESRQASSAGAEIPVLRLPSFSVRQDAMILNVPVESTSRTSLRVYGFGAARVRLYRMTGDAIVAETTLNLPLAGNGPSVAGWPARSGYALISDLAAAFPGIASGQYRIELTSMNNEWVWAFASVTNNTTQLVTAIGTVPTPPYGIVRE